jgi:hypothetical protein
MLRCEDNTTKIPFNQRHLNTILIYAFLFSITSFFGLSQNEPWMQIVAVLVPISFFAKYFYQKHYHYLTIGPEYIKTNGLISKELSLTQVAAIEYYAGKFTLKTDKQRLRIDTSIIDPESLGILTTRLKKIDAEWI